MGLDLASINNSLYTRLATDSAGSAARALLGSFPSPFPKMSSFAGAKAVFPAELLALFAGAGVVLPWAVWRGRGTSGETHDYRSILGSWWVYTAKNAPQYTLLSVATAIEQLYGASAGLAIAGGRLHAQTLQPVEDKALALNTVEVRIRYAALG